MGKPLLVTGNPGTGKSQLAERIAWELNLGPVLRFEAQSLSEANDLFYRFDLVGYLSAVESFKAAQHSGQSPTPDLFLKLGPLGEAIVRSDPRTHSQIFDAVFSPGENSASATPRPSVVLIDEIDKASRDFPNDLLNGIERREFAIRELRIESVSANPDYPPIVIISSNSERDLPAPFLRRCTFFHIADPMKEMLEAILIRKFFPRDDNGAAGAPAHAAAELLSATPRSIRVVSRTAEGHASVFAGNLGADRLDSGIDPPRRAQGRRAHGPTGQGKKAASTVAKHRDDLKALSTFLEGLAPGTTRTT